MKQNTRKSTALVSLVLVPLGLAGLGFTPGCDDRKSSTQNAPSEDYGADPGYAADFGSSATAFNLDPVAPTGVPPATQPATQPLAQSSFAGQQPHASTHTSHGGFMFLPIPYRLGYRPGPAAGFRPGTGGSTFSRSAPGSSTPRPGGGTITRGGFGSSAGAHSSGSTGS